MPFGFTLGLVVADAGSGLASATISGLTVGRTVQLYYAPRAAGVGTQAWTLGATGTAAGGSLILTATPGGGVGNYEWFAAMLDATATYADQVSPVYFRPLVDPTTASIWDRCVQQVRNDISGFNLSGLTDDKIVVGWWPRVFHNMNPAPPCILVSPMGAEGEELITNDTDDIVYGVIVLLVDSINNESQVNFTRDLLWRQIVSRAFRWQRLAGVPEIIKGVVKPDVVVHPDWFDKNLLVSGLLLLFTSREPRGLPPYPNP